MALKLIRSGPVTRQGVVSPGSGWVNVTGYNPDLPTNPYWGDTGIYHITVTAWNTDDLKIIDWDNGKGEVVAPTGGQYHTISAVMDLTDTRLVIRVLNPTDKTKVIVNMQPLSLSLSLFVASAAAFVRRWRNGAKASWFSRPGGVHTHRQRRRVCCGVGFPRALGRVCKREYSPRPRPLQGGSPRSQIHHDLQCVPLGIYRRPGNAHRLPGDARIRHTNLRERRRHHHHHTPRLTPVGVAHA